MNFNYDFVFGDSIGKNKRNTIEQNIRLANPIRALKVRNIRI